MINELGRWCYRKRSLNRLHRVDDLAESSISLEDFNEKIAACSGREMFGSPARKRLGNYVSVIIPAIRFKAH